MLGQDLPRTIRHRKKLSTAIKEAINAPVVALEEETGIESVDTC